MLESMTGFGRGEAKTRAGSINIELKSVNSKYLEIKTRMPKYYSAYDTRISSYLKKHFKRGYIDLFLGETEAPRKYALLDFNKASRLKSEAKRLSKELGLKGEIDINTFLKCKDMLYPEKNSQGLPFSTIEKALKRAVNNLKKTRLKEGSNLASDLKTRLDKISAIVSDIASKEKTLVSDVMERLRKKVKEISNGVQIEPGRIEQEVVLYAAKSDISEEVTRLRSHLKRMGELMMSSGPCGRNIDFMLQEMNREVNTIGSKVQSTDITRHVIDLKNELERIREQAQNIV